MRIFAPKPTVESKETNITNTDAIKRQLKDYVINFLNDLTGIKDKSITWKVSKKDNQFTAFILGEKIQIKEIFEIFKKIPGISMNRKESSSGKLIKRTLELEHLNIQQGVNGSNKKERMIIISFKNIEASKNDLEALKDFFNRINEMFESFKKEPQVAIFYKGILDDEEADDTCFGSVYLFKEAFISNFSKDVFPFVCQAHHPTGKIPEAGIDKYGPDKYVVYIPSLFMKNIYEMSSNRNIIDLTTIRPFPYYKNENHFMEKLKLVLDKFLEKKGLSCDIGFKGLIVLQNHDPRKIEQIFEYLKKSNFCTCRLENKYQISLNLFEVYERLVLGWNLRSPNVAGSYQSPDEDEMQMGSFLKA